MPGFWFLRRYGRISWENEELATSRSPWFGEKIIQVQKRLFLLDNKVRYSLVAEWIVLNTFEICIGWLLRAPTNARLSLGTRQRLSFSSGTNQTKFVFFWLNLSLFILQYSSTIRFLSLHSTFQGKSYDIVCDVKSWYTFLSSAGRVNTKQRMPAQPTISQRLALIFSSQLQSPPAKNELSASLSLWLGLLTWRMKYDYEAIQNNWSTAV